MNPPDEDGPALAAGATNISDDALEHLFHQAMASSKKPRRGQDTRSKHRINRPPDFRKQMAAAERGFKFDYHAVFQSSGSHRVAREAAVAHAGKLEQLRVDVVERAAERVLEKKQHAQSPLSATQP